MSIEKKFTTSFSVKRQEWTIETVDEIDVDKSAEVTASTFNGYVQQASAQYIQTLGLTLTRPHIIWCPLDTDVNDGDVLESTLGNFAVRAKQINRDGVNQHIELIVELFGEEEAEGSS